MAFFRIFIQTTFRHKKDAIFSYYLPNFNRIIIIPDPTCELSFGTGLSIRDIRMLEYFCPLFTELSTILSWEQQRSVSAHLVTVLWSILQGGNWFGVTEQCVYDRQDFIEQEHQAPMQRAAHRTTKTAPGLGAIRFLPSYSSRVWHLGSGWLERIHPAVLPLQQHVLAPPASHCRQILHRRTGSRGLFLQHYFGWNSEEQALNRQNRTNAAEKKHQTATPVLGRSLGHPIPGYQNLFLSFLAIVVVA